MDATVFVAVEGGAANAEFTRYMILGELTALAEEFDVGVEYHSSKFKRSGATVAQRALRAYNLFTILRTPSITLTELKFIKSPSLHFDNFR